MAPFKNGTLTPHDVLPKSNKKVWGKCFKGCPSYQAIIADRSHGRGCPYCAGKKIWEGNSLKFLNPE